MISLLLRVLRALWLPFAYTGYVVGSSIRVSWDILTPGSASTPAFVEVPLPRGIGVSFAVNAEASNEEAALEFVDWLATPEATSIWFDAAPGLPATTTAEVELEGVMAEASDIIASGLGRPFPDSEWPSAKPQSALFIGVQQLFSDQASVDDVLASMDEAFAG